jgi:peptidoglycan/xylan/chitin deacetylase (PgdA/CDA1 family)
VAGILGLVAGAVALTLIIVSGSNPGIVTSGPRDRPWVTLTFDADMTPQMLARLRSGRVKSWYDPTVVDELRAQSAPATIFLTGLWVHAYPDVVRSLARDPLFELENHSMDHAAFKAPCFGLPVIQSEEAKRREVIEAAAAITAVAGVRPRYFRFPGGCHSGHDIQLVRELGHEPVQWDTVSGDSFHDSPSDIVRDVLTTVRPGSIIVLHLNGAPNAPATARALRRLIPELRRRSFRLVTLRTLLADSG